MKRPSENIWTIPNLLSVIRILLVPVFVVLYLRAETVPGYRVAALVILFSGLTDMFDGQIARRLNQVSELGKALDPIADKITQAAIIFCLMTRYRWMWLLTLVFVVKELFMMINGIILLRRHKKLDGAGWYGKVSTAIFYLVMIILIAFPDLMAPQYEWAVNLMMCITGGFLILSFVMYIPQYARLYREAALEAGKEQTV